MVLMLTSCSTSRRYFNMRIGHERENADSQSGSKLQKTDTVKQQAAPTLNAENKLVKADSSLNQKNNEANKNKPASILNDTARSLSLGNEEMFDFKTARKKYGRKGPPPFVAAGLLFLVFILTILSVFLVGFYIYNSGWKIGIQNVVFLCFLIIGWVLCRRFTHWWQNYADSD
ncbi:MAG TPA: hypothetical protein VD905_13775 [Flavobacteriales bacterium]|nr:hypothetical protein [Flavobacteriales bacterium]